MSVPQNSLQKRREDASKGPEHKVLRKIASTLLNLDFWALRTLQGHEKSKDFGKISVDFTTVGNLANIKHDARLEYISRTIRRHVANLSEEDLYKIVSKPFKGNFYREMIYVGIEAFEEASEYLCYEKLDTVVLDGRPLVDSEAVHDQLCDILKLSRNLYNQIKDAAARGYLRKSIPTLKEGLGSIEEDIKELCSTLRVPHEPLVYLDDTDERTLLKAPPRDPPNAIFEQEKARSALAFIVPVTCAVSFVPACFASVFSENKPGGVKDSDFFQLVASALIQLLGIFTTFWPIYKKLRPDCVSWILSCTLVLISFFLTITAFPIYLCASRTWGGLTILAGSFVQSFLQLQLFLRIPNEKVHKE